MGPNDDCPDEAFRDVHCVEPIETDHKDCDDCAVSPTPAATGLTGYMPDTPTSPRESMDEDREQTLPNGLKVVNGCVDPPFDPPIDKKLRTTNQLQFLKTILTKYLCRYKTALPFLKPVDCNKLKIPDYYRVITNPMDMQTIKRRLQFLWYNSADECLEDFKLMFSNCYKFNSCDNYVYNCGKKLEEYLEEKLKDMPKEELEIIPCPEKPSLEELEKRATKRRPELSTEELQETIVNQNSDQTNGAKKMTTRSVHGIQLKRPVRELPEPISTPTTSTPRKVPLNTSMKFCLEIIRELLTK